MKNLTEEFIGWGYGSVGLDSSQKHWTVTDFTIKEWDMDSSQVNRLRKTKEGCKHLLSIFPMKQKTLVFM